MPDENKFVLPEMLPEDVDELKALEAEAVAAFEARYGQGVASAEDLGELQEIAESIRVVREAIATAEASESEESEDELEVEAVDASDESEDAQTEPAEAPEQGPSPAGAVLDAMLLAPKVTVKAEAPAPDVTPAPEVSAPAAPAPQAIAASASEYQLPIARPNPVTVVASADIPGIPAASKLDGMDGLVAAIGAKARSVPNVPGSRHPVASIEKPLSADRNIDGLSEREAMERLNDLSSPAFLVASGGWCAPSETIYDFACEVEAPPDAVVLPTITTNRGGIRYPVSPTFRDFFALENNGLFTWTEEDDEAAGEESPPGPTKPCFHIPCVEFAEARLELDGLCVTAGNLTDRAYPELIRRYLSLVLTGHLHRMNARRIQKMVHSSVVDDFVTVTGTFAAASSLLASLELQVQDLRDQFSMSQDAIIEAMLPRWTFGLIRADVARREQSDLDAVSNAEVRAYLANAGIAAQFVSNWQSLGDPENPALVWPSSVQVLLWVPGAYSLLEGPTLDIAVARDSTLNATNDFTVAFTEESHQVFKRGCGSRLVTVPVCPDGSVGARSDAVICASGGDES